MYCNLLIRDRFDRIPQIINQVNLSVCQSHELNGYDQLDSGPPRGLAAIYNINLNEVMKYIENICVK